jgi:2-phosphosulfolactate phosphatase
LIDVILWPALADNRPFAGQTAIVLDILRATSTMVTALGNHALEVIPVAEPEAAFKLQQKAGIERCLLGGERKGYKIPGFDLGNSPAEYTEAKISGRTVVLCTSNGTKAALWAKEAREVLIGSFLNMIAICDYLKSCQVPNDITIVCSGREGNFSLEDFTGAGMIVHLTGSNCELTDTAKVALLTYEKSRESGLTAFVGQAEHGRYLKEIGMESDIALCTDLNRYPILPRMVDGVIRL